MQESATTAVSYVRSKAVELSLDPEWLREIDLHVHVPKAGTPKDGPSAGITIFLAVLSLLLDCPVRNDVAMTGEISLRGRVLPVGGIKQKLFGAHRAGMREVLIPARNKRDLDDVPPEILAALKVTLVSTVEEVIRAALLPPRPPASDADEAQEDAASVVTASG
jgi:ATP-dependent Lon protease